MSRRTEGAPPLAWTGVRWEWDMGCDVCGLCICLQAKADAAPIVVCEVDQRVLKVRARRETKEAQA